MNASRSAIGAADDAVALVLRAGIGAWSVYFVGTAPFVTGLIAYWGSMRHSALADAHVELGALAAALLFLWMKAWQARFAQLLHAVLQHAPPPPWTPLHFGRTLAAQALLQSTGFVVLPISMLLTVPFGFAYAFYQHATALDDGSAYAPRRLAVRAFTQCQLWPRQNHLLIWLLCPALLWLCAAMVLVVIPVLSTAPVQLFEGIAWVFLVLFVMLAAALSPFGVLLAVNVAAGLLLVTQLAHVFLGIQSLFTMAPEAFLNSTFLAIVCGIAYLLLDPVVKAAYVLRRFEGESLQTGADLRARLAQLRGGGRAAAALVVGLAVFGDGSALGQEPNVIVEGGRTTISEELLDAAVEAELRKPHFAWRMPRHSAAASESNAFWRTLKAVQVWVQDRLRAIRDFVERWVDRVHEWIFGRDGDGGGASDASWAVRLRWLYVILVVVLAAALLMLARRLLAGRTRESESAPLPAAAIETGLRDESATADALPEDGWRRLAQDLWQRGEGRLAIRAAFMAVLAALGRSGAIRIARFKSNMDYLKELQRRGAAASREARIFQEASAICEAVWYGEHAPEAAAFERLAEASAELGPRPASEPGAAA